MPDEEPSKNPFVRFKQHVDANVGAGLESLFSFAALMATNSRPHTQTAMSFTSSAPAGGDGSAHPPSSQNPSWGSVARPGPAGSLQPDPRNHPDPGAYAHAWHDFLLWSPYSPIALRDLGLSPLSHRYDDDIDLDDLPFTFLDAFEDLMYAASGRPMPTLEHRSRQAESVHWPVVAGLRRADWSERFRRMAKAGVLDAYPVLDEEKRAPWGFVRWGPVGHPTYRAGQGFESEGEQATVAQPQWPRSRRQQEGDTEIWESRAVVQRPGASQDSRPSDASLFGELDRVFKTLGKVLEDEVGSFPLFGRRGAGQQDSETSEDRQDSKAPKTEDDLYSAVQSAYSAAERSLSTFLKTVSEGQFKGGMESSSSWNESSSTSFDGQADQGHTREVTSTNEYVDRYGYLHVKTETKRLNAQGEEVGRETHYSVRPQSMPSGDRQEMPKGGFIDEGWSPRPEEEPQKPRKKGGWFW